MFAEKTFIYIHVYSLNLVSFFDLNLTNIVRSKGRYMKTYNHVFKNLSKLMELKAKWESGRYSKAELSRYYKVSEPTILRNLEKLKALN